MSAPGVLVEREAVGKTQDLAKEFANAEKRSLPFTSSVPKGPNVMNAMLEYPVEKFDDPSTEGAGDEADPIKYENPREGDANLYARIQTWERAVRIGGHATTFVHQAGITPKNVVAKAIAKKLVEMKTDMETTFLGNNESQAETSAATPNKTRGLGRWIQATAQSHYPVDPNYLVPAASIDASTTTANYTDETITAVAESMFTKHGDENADIDVFCGSTWKRKLGRITYYQKTEASMTNVRHFNQDVGDDVVLGKVDVLATDYGTFKVRLSRYINSSSAPTSAASKLLAYACPMKQLELRMSEQPYMLPLARTGRNQKFLVTATGALACLNPLPFGKWAPGS
ncbi:MAG: DUF5309 family protein [Opitutaceae bacterium]